MNTSSAFVLRVATASRPPFVFPVSEANQTATQFTGPLLWLPLS